jgi:hypothetical protein
MRGINIYKEAKRIRTRKEKIQIGERSLFIFFNDPELCGQMAFRIYHSLAAVSQHLDLVEFQVEAEWTYAQTIVGKYIPRFNKECNLSQHKMD